MLVSARKLHDLGLVEGTLREPGLVEDLPRGLVTPELLEAIGEVPDHPNGTRPTGGEADGARDGEIGGAGPGHNAASDSPADRMNGRLSG